jgi:hypothetical protein
MSYDVPDPLDRAATTAKTTAQAGKKRVVPCRKGVRVCILQKKLKSAIKITSAAWNAIEHMADDYHFYGTCIESSGRGVFKIQFDQLPCVHNKITFPEKITQLLLRTTMSQSIAIKQIKRRRRLKSREISQQTLRMNRKMTTTTMLIIPLQRIHLVKGQKKKVNHSKESQEVFLKLPLPSRKFAKSFEHKYGLGKTDIVAWTILNDDEQIVEDAMDHHPPEIACH